MLANRANNHNNYPHVVCYDHHNSHDRTGSLLEGELPGYLNAKSLLPGPSAHNQSQMLTQMQMACKLQLKRRNVFKRRHKSNLRFHTVATGKVMPDVSSDYLCVEGRFVNKLFE